MPNTEQIITSFVINLVFTVMVLFLPFAAYRGLKDEPISPKKARRIVIIYMVIYCVLRIALDILGVFGAGTEANEVVNLTAVVFWSWIDIKILSKGYSDEEQETHKDDEENKQCEKLVQLIEQRNSKSGSVADPGNNSNPRQHSFTYVDEPSGQHSISDADRQYPIRGDGVRASDLRVKTPDIAPIVGNEATAKNVAPTTSPNLPTSDEITSEKKDVIFDVVDRMRTDEKFYDLVKRLYELDADK